MRTRWRILALLFAVRTTMAYQFQAVAPLAPLIQRDFGVGLADVGLLIGLYLAPGIVLALPGGAIGKRYGDRPVVIGGLALMTCGGLMMALSGSWEAQLAGRLLAGTGGVLLNVLMSKMVTDWFAGRELATAMAIFVNSWPVGIALALLTLPFVAATHGVAAAYLVPLGPILLGLFAVAAFYPTPAVREETALAASARLAPGALSALVIAGLIWGLYNAGISMVFGFGPTMLAERGWSLAAASSTTSLSLWFLAVSVPLGGLAADRSRSNDAVLIAGCLAFAALLVFAARSDAAVPAFAALGFVSGLPAGPIMSLPVRVLRAETRAVGMGVFFTLFYSLIMLGPWLGGHAASALGTARAAFDLGALMVLLGCIGALIFRKLAKQGGGLGEATVR
jgi:MFS family permease